MEFFQSIRNTDIDVDRLRQLLTLENLPALCDSITTVNVTDKDEADIYCLWGTFDVRRDVIRYGVRFSLLNCPHALAWTITLKQSSNRIVIHCTIDDEQADEEFVESIDDFMLDWSDGLSVKLATTGR